jgi:catechol 2,3-dioxygenase-like lactoylglutathione lyase family enzyme
MTHEKRAMNPRRAEPVECEMVHPTLVVSDVKAAVAFYTEKLGFSLGFFWGEPPDFAGVNLDKVQMFLSQGAPYPAGCEVYFVVDDVDALHALHLENGVKISAPPGNRDYGLRDYEIRDLDGYRLIFGQHVPAAEPKLAVERVDVPVRLEKRIAAVLKDLAEHTRMSLSECLEETLLHTFDGVGPHTQRTVDYIQTLKQKHGIDYGTHGSYRFVEKP